MENQPTATKKVPWIGLIILIILIIALIHWTQTRAKKTTDNTATAVNSQLEGYSTSTEVVLPMSTSTSPTSANTANSNTNNKNFMHTITLETNKGTIVFQSYDADAPNTVNNFITLANKGFYNGIIFHRVIENFMIQGGDPTGTGMGGPGYKFADELNPATASYKGGYTRGTVAMANSGPNTNGSQFFIMHKDTPLPNSYTIFGKVIKGIEVVDAIATTPVAAGDKPLQPVTIQKLTVTENK